MSDAFRAVYVLFFLACAVSVVVAQSATPRTIRVMSYNIRFGTAKDGENHWDHRKEFLAETIASFDPDLLGTQETLSWQRDYLAERLKGLTAFGAGRDDGGQTGEMAALFYRTERFTRIAGGHFWLSENPNSPGSKGWDAALPRIATWVKLRVRDDSTALPIFFLNTHFDHRGRKASAESARLIVEKTRELSVGCRVVITGDFNAGVSSDAYRTLFAASSSGGVGLVDTFAQMNANEAGAGTFSNFLASQTEGARIDWIAASRDWDVRLASIDRTAREGRTPSDHFAVTAVLRTKKLDGPPTIRVLSYNIHHGEGMDRKIDLPRLAKVIRAADADFVALQEVDRRTKRVGGVDQSAELARLTGMHGVFGKAIDLAGGEYGQAVLSRTPIGTSVVSKLPNDPGKEQRILLTVAGKIHDRPVTFATTHLDHQSDGLRQRQAASFDEILGRSDPKSLVILAGDLNATPNDRTIAMLSPKWTIAAGPDLCTFPSGKPNVQIDYVLFRRADSLRFLGSSVIAEPLASDHRPLLSVLELSR